MARVTFDAVVVGAGPAGSTAALVLARGGARVALVDKATFARDKACGDLVGPRALALLESLGLEPPAGRVVGEMVVVGPTGRRVLLPARGGRTYPDHGLALPRVRFDSWLRDEAIAAGAEPVTGHVANVDHEKVELDDGRCLFYGAVVGADGATSAVGTATGLVDPRAVLWGFAQRGYVAQDVDRPIIALWDETPGHGFPGYGWLFPGEAGAANVGLGLGLLHDRSSAKRAVVRFDAFCNHLRGLGLLDAPVQGRRLGGWLKMGMVGTVAARGRVFLVGDAAGLVNPLQGEGIAPAMTSAALAAEAILADPGSAARRYREQLGRRARSICVRGGPHPCRGSIRAVPSSIAPRWNPHVARRWRSNCAPVGAVMERPARRCAARPDDHRISPRTRPRAHRHNALGGPPTVG